MAFQSYIVTLVGFLPWSKLLARRQAGLLERERASWAAIEPLEDQSEEQTARAQLRRSVMGTIVEQRVMVYVHQVEVSAYIPYLNVLSCSPLPWLKSLYG